MDKVFLDTNVVIDFLCERGNFYLPAAKIVVKAYHEEIELCCSAVTFATASFLMERSKIETETIFRKLADFCTLCSPVAVDRTTIERSLESEFTDFEDALQHFAAVEAGADYIITRNKKDFEHSILAVMEPQEYLNE